MSETPAEPASPTAPATERSQSHFTSAMPRVIATCFSLAAFSVALVAGLARDNPAAQVLLRALACMILCYPVGWLVGRLCQHVINDHVRAHEGANPAPALAPKRESASEPADNEEVITV